MKQSMTIQLFYSINNTNNILQLITQKQQKLQKFLDKTEFQKK
jgi:hypothetical protein